MIKTLSRPGKTFLLILFLLIFIGASVSQPRNTYTSGNKKAMKHLEKAADAYRDYRYDEAYQIVGKAIKADSSFIEAWLLLAEMSMETGKNDLAITALEWVVAIDPGFHPKSLYHLANLNITIEQYKKALMYLGRYNQFKYLSEQFRAQIDKSIATCHFAIDAINAPVPFNPHNLGEGVNTNLDEYWPTLTLDEGQLLFTRRDFNKKNYDGNDENLYISSLHDYIWRPAKPVGPPVNTRYHEGAAAISPDGQTIIFTACEMNGSYGNGRSGFGRCDLFYTYRTGNQWSEPQNMGRPVNSPLWESQPAFDADGKTLYFVRNNIFNDGSSRSDIYLTRMDDFGKWSNPAPVGKPISTDGNESSVYIHPDGQTLYFTSDGHLGMGGLDLFMSRKLLDGSWDTPVNLGYPINTSSDETGFIVGASGKIAYFSSNRDGGYGGMDIYSFELPEQFRPQPVSYLKGIVYDANSTLPLEARFELVDLNSGKVVITSFSNPGTGDFMIALSANARYALSVHRDGYLFYSDHFEFSGNHSSIKPFKKDIPLQPIKTGESVVLKNIFFDTDQYTLKSESSGELNKLLTLLKSNPDIHIEIGGHTDNTGNFKHNELLSENRAKAVFNFLVSNGIVEKRMSYKGYADTVPIADNRTDEGKAQNRRTEFKIVSSR